MITLSRRIIFVICSFNIIVFNVPYFTYQLTNNHLPIFPKHLPNCLSAYSSSVSCTFLLIIAFITFCIPSSSLISHTCSTFRRTRIATRIFYPSVDVLYTFSFILTNNESERIMSTHTF